MARKQLILDRYEVIGLAGSGGFGTVQIAWDRRIQRKVAIKTIQLTDRDARRAALPGADAVAVVEDAAEVEKETPTAGDKPEPRTPPKAQTPAQARARREAETAQRAAEQEALSQAWEESWVQVPQNVVNTLSLDSLPMIDLEASKSESAQEQKQTRSSSLVLPEIKGSNVSGENENAEVTEALEVVNEDATCVIPLVIDDQAEEAEDEEIVPDEAVDVFNTDDEFIVEPDEALDPSELVNSSALEEPDDDFVPPTTIIEEARKSLKDLSAFDAHESWDGKHPWDNSEDEASDQAEQDGHSGEDGHITALAHIPGLDEARTAAKLSDPRIVAVYDFEVRGQVAYLIMEYIEGITLTELLADYADYLTIDMVTGVFDAVAGALEIAHDAGVLHLDIKPDNIIINKDGQAKMTDFGLATLADASGGGFAGGGTIGYMPLEQMRRESLDARTDEWSLAAVAYEMLTGSNPFRARTLAEAEDAIIDAELLLPSLCWPSLDSQLDDVIFYALDPNREERYANIEDFADEADKFLGDAAAGEEQLALVVEDALMGNRDGAPPDDTVLVQEDESRKGLFGLFGHRNKNAEAGDTRLMSGQQQAARLQEDGEGLYGAERGRKRRRGGLFAPREDEPVVRDALAEKLDRFDPRESFDDLADEMDDVVASIPRAPLFQRVPEKLVNAGARIFSAGGSALVGTYALANMQFMSQIPGGFSFLIALAFAALGAILPLYGALIAFCVLGISICLAGHPIVGVILIVASALWWYVVGREGPAESNVALLGPLAGSIGGTAVTPLFAGAALKPLQAAITMVYCVLIACVFASLGSESLLGWDIFAHSTFADTNITLAFGRMFTRPLTWTMAAGWIGGAVLFSLLNLGGRRWTFVVGLIVCVACVLAGTLVFTAPTPQLFISLIVGAAILLIVFV